MSPSKSIQVRRIARKLLGDAKELAQQMLSEIRAQNPEWETLDALQLNETLLASCLANIRTGCEHMAGDLNVPGEPPADARELAQLSARMDISLAALLGSYRIGYAMMIKRWYAELEHAQLSTEERSNAMQAAFDYLFEYVERISAFVTDAYTAERDRLLRSREQRRAQLVRQILDGTASETNTLDLLDYDLRLEHIACVLCGLHPEAALRDLARTFSAPHRLLIALSTELAWGWLGRTQPFPAPDLPAAGAGQVIYLGDPGSGVEGFRNSHRQALETHRVGSRSSDNSARFDDLALEALGSLDNGRARDFVRRELGPLAGAEARAERLRETLQAYFQNGHNAVATATRLGVHEHTVSYRLRSIERLIGRSIAGRHAELETALRLIFVLDAQTAQQD